MFLVLMIIALAIIVMSNGNLNGTELVGIWAGCILMVNLYLMHLRKVCSNNRDQRMKNLIQRCQDKNPPPYPPVPHDPKREEEWYRKHWYNKHTKRL